MRRWGWQWGATWLRGGGPLVALLACGGHASDVELERRQSDTRGSAPDALVSGLECEGLLAAFRGELGAQVVARAEEARAYIRSQLGPSALGSSAFSLRAGPASPAEHAAGPLAARPASASAEPSPPAAAPPDAGATLGDVLALEGERLYVLHIDHLYVVDLSQPDALPLLATVPIEGEPTQLFVRDGRVLVLSNAWLLSSRPGRPSPLLTDTAFTKLTWVDTTLSPAAVERELYVEGSAEEPAHQLGGVVRHVLQLGRKGYIDSPRLVFTDMFGLPFSPEEVELQVDVWEAITNASIEDTVITDYLPLTLERQGDQLAASPLACPDILLPRGVPSPDVMTHLIGVDLDVPAAPVSTLAVFVSTSGAYVDEDAWVLLETLSSEAPSGIETRLHRLDLEGLTARYVSSGSVEGSIDSPRLLDERNGVLRALVTRWEAGPRAQLVTFRAERGQLVELGRSEAVPYYPEAAGTVFTQHRAFMFANVGLRERLLTFDLASHRSPTLLAELPGELIAGQASLVDRRLLTLAEVPHEAGFGLGLALQLFEARGANAPVLLHEHVHATEGSTSATFDARLVDIDLGRGRIALPFSSPATSSINIEVFASSPRNGFTHLGSVAPHPYEVPLEDCLPHLGYPSDPAFIAGLEADPALLESLRASCTNVDVHGPAHARRGLLRGEELILYTSQGVDVHAIGDPSGPPLRRVSLPPIQGYDY